MVEYEGNVLRPPGVGPETQQPDVEELLASTVGYTQKGGTVESGAGVLEVGTPVTFNGTSGFWEKVDDVAAGQVQGFVRNAVDVTTEDKLINVVVKGTIKTAVRGLTGVDAEDLATSIGGGARVIPAFGWLTF